MLEIIALIFLCKKNGDLALRKGLKAGTWKLYTVLAWIVAEFIGAVLGIILLGRDNLIGAAMIAIASAFGGYLLVRAILEKKPDHSEDDINSIGVNDLKP